MSTKNNLVDDRERPDADALAPVDNDDLAKLRTRLAEAADEQGLLDVAYRDIDTPVGPMLLAATDQGLVRVAFGREDFDQVLGTLAERISPRILHDPGRLDRAASQFDEYFGGTRRRFDLRLDLRLSSGFRQTVQRFLSQIAYGQTLTYSQVAEQVGNPKAVRAVGSACATNPLPVIVPCHRVLRADGTLGGYLGGLEVKAALLRMEHQAA